MDFSRLPGDLIAALSGFFTPKSAQANVPPAQNQVSPAEEYMRRLMARGINPQSKTPIPDWEWRGNPGPAPAGSDLWDDPMYNPGGRFTRR